MAASAKLAITSKLDLDASLVEKLAYLSSSFSH